MIQASAPGKLMLMGEHSVVYGYPCLVTAISQRIVVSAEIVNGEKTIVEAPMVKDTRFIDASVRIAKETWNINESLHIKVHEAFPNTYGFGSSSAVTVATLVAIAASLKKEITKETLFALSFEVVKEVQGTGSGFDVAAAVWGGTLYYNQFGTQIIELPPLDSAVKLLVGYTGVKADTTTLVNQVADNKKKYPERVDKIFVAITQLVNQAKDAYQLREWETVGKLMSYNQEYLRDLGISSEKLESLIVAAQGSGAYGAKLSGAGGGDCMIALVPVSRVSIVSESIVNAGGIVVEVESHAQLASAENLVL